MDIEWRKNVQLENSIFLQNQDDIVIVTVFFDEMYGKNQSCKTEKLQNYKKISFILKIVRVRSFSGAYFSYIWLNKEIYRVYISI